jgi:GT2 family glycosyltransferase
MYAEEVDWCYAMKRAGWQVWYQPSAVIVHYGGASSRHRQTQREADLYRSRVRFFRKHYGDLSARALKLLLYALTAIKLVAHRLLRLVSGNRRGRRVVSLSDLQAALRGA